MAAGDYTIEAAYSGTATFKASADATPATLSLVRGSILLSNVRGDGRYRGAVTYTATLLGPGGVPVAGQVVAFTVRGIAVCNPAGGIFNPCPRTDANGVATLTIAMNLVAPGTFPDLVGVSFAGDGVYEATSGTGPLVITP